MCFSAALPSWGACVDMAWVWKTLPVLLGSFLPAVLATSVSSFPPQQLL